MKGYGGINLKGGVNLEYQKNLYEKKLPGSHSIVRHSLALLCDHRFHNS